MWNRKTTLIAIKVLFTIGIVFFVGRFLIVNYASIRNASFSLRPLNLILASTVFGFGFLTLAAAWKTLIAMQGTWPLDFLDALWIWMVSFMGRYIPGKVALVAARVVLARSRGIPAGVTTSTVAFEMILLLAASAIVSLPVILTPRFVEYRLPIVLFLATMASVIAGICTFSRLRKRIKLMPLFRNLPSIQLKPRSLVKAFLLYIFYWILAGFGVCVFTSGIVPIDLHHYPLLISAYVFSFTLGLLAVFVPSGLGVREAAFAAFLLTIVPLETALLLSVLVRFWTTACELMVFAILYLAKGKQKRPGSVS